MVRASSDPHHQHRLTNCGALTAYRWQPEEKRVIKQAPRRFPPPWSLEELNDACFVAIDNAGQKLAYVYFEEEPGRRSAAKLLTKDEAMPIFV